MRKDGELTYLHTDHLGSASLATDATGGVASEMRYYPYGQTRSGTMATDRRYTGQRWEAGIGLYDYNARYYDPALGRFVQADSVVPSMESPQDFNRYSYVRGNPLKYVDPSGHEPITVIIAIGIVLFKAVDYGWTAYDMWQSARVLSNPNAGYGDKLMAGLNIGVAVLFEAAEPDDTLPVGLPLDDAGRRAVMKGAREAFEEGGGEALERFLQDTIGDRADDVLRSIDNALGLDNIKFPDNPGQIDHIFRDASGHMIEDTFDNRKLLTDTLSSRNFVKTDEFGNNWFARLLDNGTEVWVKVRNGMIRNGGINPIPKHLP
jgi:RHS repeat-associated protein